MGTFTTLSYATPNSGHLKDLYDDNEYALLDSDKRANVQPSFGVV